MLTRERCTVLVACVDQGCPGHDDPIELEAERFTGRTFIVDDRATNFVCDVCGGERHPVDG